MRGIICTILLDQFEDQGSNKRGGGGAVKWLGPPSVKNPSKERSVDNNSPAFTARALE